MLQNVIPRDVFIEELKAAVPEADDLVTEHLADDGELLLHLLMSDLLRITVRTFHEGQPEVTDRLPAFGVSQTFRPDLPKVVVRGRSERRGARRPGTIPRVNGAARVLRQ